MSNLNPEREIRDMDEAIEGLESVIYSLEDVINKDILKKMNDVVDEWRGATKGCIEELAALIEIL